MRFELKALKDSMVTSMLRGLSSIELLSKAMCLKLHQRVERLDFGIWDSLNDQLEKLLRVKPRKPQARIDSP